jgi:hypothetical protein
MGEPDTPFVLRRLLNAIEFQWWRNPMKVKYVAPAATIVMAAIVAILFLALINSDDDQSDNSPVPAGSPTVPVNTAEPPDLEATVQRAFDDATATAEAQPTPVPQPTNTPEATATVEPTSTPEPTPTLTPVAYPPNKAFPDALRYDAEPLPEEEVLALWTEYLTNTSTLGTYHRFGSRHTGETKLCSDGNGNRRFLNASFGNLTWDVRQVEDEWNRVAVYSKAPADADNERGGIYVRVYGHDENGLVVNGFDTFGVADISLEQCQRWESTIPA